jgi:hypothetical protein
MKTWHLYLIAAVLLVFSYVCWVRPAPAAQPKTNSVLMLKSGYLIREQEFDGHVFVVLAFNTAPAAILHSENCPCRKP